MAKIGSEFMTLADHAKMFKDGKLFKMVMMLSQKNRMLDDAVFIQCNNGDSHKVSVQTSLPETFLKLLNKGTPVSKGTSDIYDEQIAIFESWSDIEDDVANLGGGDIASIRLRRAKEHMESMSQKVQQSIIYGSAATAADLIGFANRLDALTGSPASENVIDCEGTDASNVASFYLIGWGQDKIALTYPKGSKAGFEHIYHGKRVSDLDDLRTVMYSDQWKQKLGIAFEDRRYAVRGANISVPDLKTISGTQAKNSGVNVIDKMIRSIDHLPDREDCKPCFYVNRGVASGIRALAKAESNGAVTIEPAVNQFGRSIHTLMLQGIPIKIVDQLSNFEAVVT